MSKRDDDIIVISPKTKQPTSIMDSFIFPFVKGARAIPVNAMVSKAFVWRKTPGENAVEIALVWDQGVTLKYKDKVWREEGDAHINISFDHLAEIIQDSLRILRRYHRANYRRALANEDGDR